MHRVFFTWKNVLSDAGRRSKALLELTDLQRIDYDWTFESVSSPSIAWWMSPSSGTWDELFTHLGCNKPLCGENRPQRQFHKYCGFSSGKPWLKPELPSPGPWRGCKPEAFGTGLTAAWGGNLRKPFEAPCLVRELLGFYGSESSWNGSQPYALGCTLPLFIPSVQTNMKSALSFVSGVK